MGLNNQSWEFHGQNSHILFLGIPRIFLRIPKSLLKGSFQIDLEFGSGGKPHFHESGVSCKISTLLEDVKLETKTLEAILIWKFAIRCHLARDKVIWPETNIVRSQWTLGITSESKDFLGFHMTTPKFKKKTTNSSAILLSWVNTAAKHLNIIYKSFLFESVLRFAIEDGWISRLLRDVEFRWPSRRWFRRPYFVLLKGTPCCLPEQSFVNLGETLFRISRIWNYRTDLILGEAFCIFIYSHFPDYGLSVLSGLHFFDCVGLKTESHQVQW